MDHDPGQAAVPLREGMVLGDYVVLSEIGHGGMGAVFRAHDRRLKRDVALKCPFVEGSILSDEARRRFLREAQALARLSNPHVVTVHEVVDAGDVPCIVMELCEGTSLRVLLDGRGALPIDEMLGYGEQVAEGLRAAHAEGILHRDVKPGNIIVTPDGRARLADFGLAHIFVAPGPGGAEDSTLTLLTGDRLIGTPGYMSPEQVLGRELDPRSDIFSLGVVLYEACTGRAAFPGQSRGEVLDAVLHVEPPATTEIRRDLPPSLDWILRKAMAKRVEDRYRTAEDLGLDLRRLRTGSMTAAGRPAAAPPAAPFRRGLDRRWVIPVVAALAIVTAILGRRELLRRGAPLSPGKPPLMMPVVEWSSAERDGRFSPDARWISFVSDRGGRDGIWIADGVGGGTPRPLPDLGGRVLDHRWHPAGDRILALVRGGGVTRLISVPAPLGGEPLSRPSLPDSASFTRIAGWSAGPILEDPDGVLWRIDESTLEVRKVLGRFPELEYQRQFDVAEDGAFVFAGVAGGVDDLWTGRIGDAAHRRLTSDPFLAADPRWVDPARGSVMFVSNQSGQEGLWLLDVSRETLRAIPFARRLERLGAVAQGGERVLAEAVEQRSTLRDRSRSGSDTPLGHGGRYEIWASIDPVSGRTAYQRARALPVHGAEFVDSEIILATPQSAGGVDGRVVAASGFQPLLSPGGSRLAYLRFAAGGRDVGLVLLDLETEREILVHPRFAIGGFSHFPSEFLGRNAIWDPSGAGLHFVALGEDRVAEVRAFAAGQDSAAAGPICRAPGPSSRIRDLTLTGNGRSLAFLEEDDAADQWRIREVGLDAGGVTTLLTQPFSIDVEFQLAGWRRSGSLVLLEARATGRSSQSVRILDFRPGNPLREIARVDGLFAATARLDAGGDRLLATAEIASGCALVGIDLTSGASTEIVRPNVGGSTIASIVPLPDGRVVYALEERNQDVWVLRFDPPGSPAGESAIEERP